MSDAAAPPSSGASGASASSNTGLLVLAVIASVAITLLVGWRLRNIRRWRMRARSAKVLDEIEMEFVNDDVDMFVLEDELEDVTLHRRVRPPTKAAIFPFMFSSQHVFPPHAELCACHAFALPSRRGNITSSTWGSERSAPL